MCIDVSTYVLRTFFWWLIFIKSDMGHSHSLIHMQFVIHSEKLCRQDEVHVKICVTQQTISLLWQHSHTSRKIGCNGQIVLMSQLQLLEKLVFSSFPQIVEYIYKRSYWFIDQKGAKKARNRICKINKRSLLLVHILLWWKCIKRWPSSTATCGWTHINDKSHSNSWFTSYHEESFSLSLWFCVCFFFYWLEPEIVACSCT